MSNNNSDDNNGPIENVFIEVKEEATGVDEVYPLSLFDIKEESSDNVIDHLEVTEKRTHNGK